MSRPTGLDIFIYLRKSRKDIEEEKKATEEGRPFDTLDKHRNQLLEVAKKEQHRIIDIFPEIVSGEFIIERPEVQDMLRQVESGIVDGVLVMDLDRFGRGDMVDQGTIYRIFKNSETLILTPSEVIDPQDENQELVYSVKSLVAREELKAITKRMQRGRRASAKEGKSVSAKPPFGYLRDGNLKLYTNPETAWIVIRVFEMMASSYGRRQVALWLDTVIKPPQGGANWSDSSVEQIVKNEVYIGHIIWGKFRSTKINGKYVRKRMSKEKWFRHDNAHEPIVSLELFNSANKAYSGRWKPSTTKSNKLSNPLAGVLICELCSRSMVYQPRPDRPNDYIRCMNPACKGIQKGATLELVEERILEGLQGYIDAFQWQGIDVNPPSILPLKEKQLMKRTKEMDDLIAQKNNLHDLLEKGVYDIPTFLDRQKTVVEKMKDIEAYSLQLSDEITQEKNREENREQYVPQLRKALSAYRSTKDVEKKNRLLKSVLEKATYLRNMDMKQKDEFVIKLYTAIK